MMKIIIILFICVFSVSLYAQNDIEEFYPEGTVWEYESHAHTDDFSLSRYWRCTVAGDTVINGVTYKKVTVMMRVTDGGAFVDAWDRNSPWHWEYDHSYGIREANGKVYFYGVVSHYSIYDTGFEYESLRYDYNWKVGKTIPFGAFPYPSNGFMTQKIDTIESIELLDGNVYDMVKGPHDEFQVRTIGQLSGPCGIFEINAYFPPWNYVYYNRVMNFTRNGTLLYEWDNSSYMGIRDQGAARKPDDGNIYDMRGVCRGKDPNHSLPPGIYIRDGKKMIIK